MKYYCNEMFRGTHKKFSTCCVNDLILFISHSLVIFFKKINHWCLLVYMCQCGKSGLSEVVSCWRKSPTTCSLCTCTSWFQLAYLLNYRYFICFYRKRGQNQPPIPAIKLFTSKLCDEPGKYLHVERAINDCVIIFSGVHKKFLSSASFPTPPMCGLLESLCWSYFHMEWNLGQDWMELRWENRPVTSLSSCRGTKKILVKIFQLPFGQVDV